MSQRVVITGMGIYSCIGKNKQEVLDSLFNGKSGIGIAEERRELGYRSCLCGILEKPNLKGKLDRRQRLCLSEHGQYAFLATEEALAQAGIDEEYLAQHEVGVLYGNDSSAEAVITGVDVIREKKNTILVGSGNIFQSMNSTVNMNMSTVFHLRGVNFSVSAACASGSHSIGLAYLLIKQGLQDIILCGGAQEVNKYAMASFDALGAFSKRMDEPTKASRPFDKNRDGLIPSGGAAALVLESYEHAIERGATIIAEVCGYGFSSNGGGISQPSDDGSYTAMMRALKDAGIEADEIDYVNAHATSTHQGDMFESIALTRLFDGKKALISSTKSMTGHECWMAGASEAVYSLIMMNNNFIAPNINFENPDEYSCKLNIATQTIDCNIDTILSNSFGFGGTNSALVLKKYSK
jgi:3-oxoacyl-[acyl-carrier-protein] synthase-1